VCFNILKKGSVLFFFICCAKISFAQCQAILPFTEKAMEEIYDVYQFTFLHKKPQNKLDSLVLQIMNPQIIIDSNYFDWNYTSPQTRALVDRLQQYKIIDQIGALKTNEAFLLLHLHYLLPFKMEDDSSPLATFCSNIAYYGGPMIINKYYLQNAISTQLAFPEFTNAVVAKSLLMLKAKLKGINYCKPLQGEARSLYEMSLTNPTPYDSTIETVMDKYFNHYANAKNYYSRDSILMEIYQLPFTHDVIWDDCIAKVASEDGIAYDKLGVIINVGKDMYNQNIYIQRVYEVKNDRINGQKIVSKTYFADFVSQVRRQCAGIDE
jgi:hypothetical protein